jgi:hypothetical protein
MKKCASSFSALLLLLYLVMFVGCPEPNSLIAFEHNGKLKERIELDAAPANAHLRVSGWGVFQGEEYELRLSLVVLKESKDGDLEICPDSLHVRYNDIEMEPIEIGGPPGFHQILELKEILNLRFRTGASWARLPRDKKGDVKDVKITILMNGLLRFNGQACSIDPLVAWERKAGTYARVARGSVAP